MAAVASRSEGNAHAFATAHGVDVAYDTYEDMVAAPDLDIVYVGTPDTVHKEHCLMAIGASEAPEATPLIS